MSNSSKNQRNAPGFLSPLTRQTLLQSPQGSSEEILAKKNFIVDEVVKSGAHGEVSFGRGIISPRTETFAVKMQLLKSPNNYATRGYRELIIFRKLNKIREDAKWYPNSAWFGFVHLLDSFKSMEQRQFLHLVLEKADMTLNDLRSLTIYEYRCVLFQTLFGLRVAQKELEFVHNDLHLSNVLLKMPDAKSGPSGILQDAGHVWHVCGWIVKLADFGLSRITLDFNKQTVIHDTARPLSALFTATADVEKLADEFRRIQVRPLLSRQELLHFKVDTSSIDFVGDYVDVGAMADGDLKTKLTAILKGEIEKLRGLRRRMRKGKSPEDLIHEQFFEVLKTPIPEQAEGRSEETAQSGAPASTTKTFEVDEGLADVKVADADKENISNGAFVVPTPSMRSTKRGKKPAKTATVVVLPLKAADDVAAKSAAPNKRPRMKRAATMPHLASPTKLDVAADHDKRQLRSVPPPTASAEQEKPAISKYRPLRLRKRAALPMVEKTEADVDSTPAPPVSRPQRVPRARTTPIEDHDSSLDVDKQKLPATLSAGRSSSTPGLRVSLRERVRGRPVTAANKKAENNR